VPSTATASSRPADDGVHQAARSVATNTWGERGARIGLGARGVAFLVLAYLVARIAEGALGSGGSSSKPASGPGVAQAIAAQSGGRAVLALLGIGLELFALFSLLDAVRHYDDESSAAKRWAKRAMPLWDFLVYAAFGIYCLVTAASSSGGQKDAAQSDRQQTQWSARVLRWPAGPLWLGIVGLVLVITAVVLVVRCVRREFLDHLERERMSRRTRQSATVLGEVGFAGRAAMFGLVAWFVFSAAVENDPRKGKGVDGSARTLADSAPGPYALWALAIALGAFGVYMFVEARYRKV
jgi:Domain of Unknown Function (DUF1206)